MRTRSVAGRAVLLAVVALYALLAVISAADRGERVPAGGRLSVPPYPAQALTAQARDKLTAGDYRGALPLARMALLANPMEPTSPALLGAALLGVGDDAGARQAFTVAGSMGWRVPLTQTYWMEVALAAGDYRVAALRFDALALQDATITANVMPAREFERNAAGQQALADQIRQTPAWLGTYLNPAGAASAEALLGRAGVIQNLMAGGMRIGCSDISGFLSRLIDAGQAQLAQSLWRQSCPNPGGGLLLDGQFGHLQPDQPNIFGWQLSSDPDVTVAPLGAPGAGVRLSNTAPARRSVLRQLVVLPPGSYRLSWAAKDARGLASEGIAATTNCLGEEPVQLGVVAKGAGSFAGDFSVGPQCKAVWISFQVLPGLSDATLSSVALAPVSR